MCPARVLWKANRYALWDTLLLRGALYYSGQMHYENANTG